MATINQIIQIYTDNGDMIEMTKEDESLSHDERISFRITDTNFPRDVTLVISANDARSLIEQLDKMVDSLDL